jgi:hypothetical protein
VAAFALNLAVYLLIGKTSALTMNIAGARLWTWRRPAVCWRSASHTAQWTSTPVELYTPHWVMCTVAGVAKDWMLIGLSVLLYKSPVSAINLGALQAACMSALVLQSSSCVQKLFGGALGPDSDMDMRAGGYLVAFAAVLW